MMQHNKDGTECNMTSLKQQSHMLGTHKATDVVQIKCNDKWGVYPCVWMQVLFCTVFNDTEDPRPHICIFSFLMGSN